jgi:hypothetical protein
MHSGFQHQPPGSGACGKYCIQHAFLLLGIPLTMERITQATRCSPARTDRYGMDESDILRGIRELRGTPAVFNLADAKLAKTTIDRCLADGIPLIASAENEQHWLTIAGREMRGEYIWINSNCDKIICHGNWKKLDKKISAPKYYFIAIKSVIGRHKERSLVPTMNKIAHLLWRDNRLMQSWGDYLEDLVAVCTVKKKTLSTIAASKFLSRNSRTILQAVAHQNELFNRKKANKGLNNYRIVAGAHHLALSPKGQRKAIARIAASLTLKMWTVR